MSDISDAPAGNRGAAAKRWPKLLAAYREPREWRSTFEILVTALPFLAFWVTMWLLVEYGYWWAALLLAVPAAGFLVRLFMIQHDCGHDAFFRRRNVNDWVGRVLGVLTFTPYDYWRRTHQLHHATSGNLQLRGIGDITTLTVAEYSAMSRLQRLGYRLYRHPIVMFGIGPAYLFLLQFRLPVGLMREGWRPWLSAMSTNLAIALAALVLIMTIGIGPFLMVQLPIVIIGASMGVWLFYVQHQFETTTWSRPPDWSHAEAALHGSSYYDLPPVLRWMTANIGVHHVHHLCSRIPYYRLPEVLHRHPELKTIGRITVLDSLRLVRLVLWDEANGRLVPFKGWKEIAPA